MIEQAFILAGGLGMRLGALTQDAPKPMMMIGGKPFLEYLIVNLARHGIKKIILSVGYLGEQIVNYFGNGTKLGVAIHYVYEASPAGTAGALKLAEDLFEDSFLMLNGDTLFDVHYLDLAFFHAQHPQSMATLALRQEKDTQRYGSISLDGDVITSFTEKSQAGDKPALINSGVYVLNKKILEYIPKIPASIEKDVFPVLAKEKHLFGKVYPKNNFFIDIGLPDTLSLAKRSIPAWEKKQTRALKGKYLVKNPLLHLFLKTADCILKFLPKSYQKPSAAIKRILLSNLGHLGDVVISTAILDVLKKNFPEAKIGIVVGSWSKNVVEHHPLITWVHTVDHWKNNRSSKNIVQKWKQYRSSARRALKEMKTIQYDLAIDLSFHFPNGIPLLWKAKIPRRIGYTSGGFGPLLTDSLEWKDYNQHVAFYQLDLLKLIPLTIVPEKLKTALPSTSVTVKNFPMTDRPYIVCHLGTGTPVKEWPLPNWKSLIEKLLHDHVVVLTGAGTREEEKIKQLHSHQCLNLCNQLTWDEFVSVIQNAELVIASDSVAGHIASAFDRPSITVGHGINNPHHWKPLSEKNIFLTFPTPCAPCYQGKGCREMSCLHKIEVQEILSITAQLTGKSLNYV